MDDATFRRPRSHTYLGLAGVIFCGGLGAAGVVDALTNPNPKVPDRRPAVVYTGGAFLGIVGVFAWFLADARRHRLITRGNRLTLRGVVRRVEIDFRDVTRARWRCRTSKDRHWRLDLRAGRTRWTVDFDNYASRAVDQIVDLLRERIPPEVQEGWEPFADRETRRRRRPDTAKLAPGEVVVSRANWDRIFWGPIGLAIVLSGAAAWPTGQWGFLLVSPGLVIGAWLALRSAMPPEGMINRRVSSFDPEDVQLILFLLIWYLAGIIGLVALVRLVDQPDQSGAALIGGLVGWLVVPMVVIAWETRRSRLRREREAADLAAKARGEAPDEFLAELL